MKGAKDCSVSECFSQLRYPFHEGFLRDLIQNLFVEKACYFLLLDWNRCVLIGQIRVTSPAVNDHKAISHGVKINIKFLDDWIGRVSKINGQNIPDGGSCQIHQPGRLAKVNILCILADLRNLHWVCFSTVEQAVDHIADQDLKRSR